jgi:hypothetical protein
VKVNCIKEFYTDNKIVFLSKYASGKDGVLYLMLFYNKVNTLCIKFGTARHFPTAVNILSGKQGSRQYTNYIGGGDFSFCIEEQPSRIYTGTCKTDWFLDAETRYEQIFFCMFVYGKILYFCQTYLHCVQILSFVSCLRCTEEMNGRIRRRILHFGPSTMTVL